MFCLWVKICVNGNIVCIYLQLLSLNQIFSEIICFDTHGSKLFILNAVSYSIEQIYLHVVIYHLLVQISFSSFPSNKLAQIIYVEKCLLFLRYLKTAFSSLLVDSPPLPSSSRSLPTLPLLLILPFLFLLLLLGTYQSFSGFKLDWGFYENHRKKKKEELRLK